MILPKQGQNDAQGASSNLQKTFQFRRMPAVPRKIAEINAEKDIRVRLLGRVIDKYTGTVVLDDGTGKAEIIIEDANISFDNIKSGDLVRIFCRVLPLETTYELRAEIIQKMDSMDMDLHKKIYG
jgi:uncharacterized protein YdeI (BOF family)